jgi:hypothetical protein
MCAGIHLQETAAAQALLARQARATPALPAAPPHLTPVRPKRPASGDISVVLAYLHELERYADHLEQALAALESAPAAPTNDSPLGVLADRVALVEDWIEIYASQAPTLVMINGERRALDDISNELQRFADDPAIDDAAFEDLARRIGAATLALITLAETGSAPHLAEVMA